MNEIIQALEKIRKEFKGKIGENAGIIIGEDWLLASKTKVKKCLVSSRLTRKAVATAAKDSEFTRPASYKPILITGGVIAALLLAVWLGSMIPGWIRMKNAIRLMHQVWGSFRMKTCCLQVTVPARK